ncbi:hypothetical protein [Noviherbaspirillum aerium]|uniref:hypothetical protein n=1 Tax=Noviherbaspirillum aerium TaxID=2588497 RepID=UPI00124E0B70|nr:hypothetical protein [Noviherbaspirillum aerium]
MADQNKDGKAPISSGVQPGPGERLQDAASLASGTSGSSGITGTTGTPGTLGATGTSNTPGASSATGTSGTTGTRGTSGTASSAAGSSGGIEADVLTSGSMGTSGTTGMSGMSGTSDTMSSTKDKVKESSARIAEQARQYAGDMASRVKETSRTMFDERKETAVGQVDNVANVIRNTASQLHGQGQDQVAQYVEMLADQLQTLSGRLREKDLDTLIDDVQGIARRAPGTFFLGAVAAGFLLARFIKSSSEQARYQQLELSESNWRTSSSARPVEADMSSSDAAAIGADGTPGTGLGTTGAGVGSSTSPLNGTGTRSGGGTL